MYKPHPSLPYRFIHRTADGGKPYAVCVRDHDGGLGQLFHAHRLSDEPDGVRPGRVQVHRLLPRRQSAEFADVARIGHHHPTRVAVLRGHPSPTTLDQL
jgi:hypothetical protein